MAENPVYREMKRRILDAMHADPFQPFDIKMLDGDSVRVADYELICRSPSCSQVIVHAKEQGLKILQVNRVIGVDPIKPKRRKYKKK